MAREYIEEGSTKYLKALVKMDPADTFSTGGIVEKICRCDTVLDEMHSGQYLYLDTVEAPSGYLFIECPKETQEGWIYTDKTNIFVDSNSQA